MHHSKQGGFKNNRPKNKNMRTFENFTLTHLFTNFLLVSFYLTFVMNTRIGPKDRNSLVIGLSLQHTAIEYNDTK